MLTDLSIGLRTIGPDVAVLDLTEGLVEGPALVGEGVVGHDSLDDDPVGPVPGFGPTPESRAGDSGLVGEHLGVGQSGVVVHGRVNVRIADATLLGLADGLAPVDLVTPSSGDLAQLLHVDVDQLTRTFALVAT